MSAGGLAGFRNVMSTVMQSFAITCEISVLWLMLGYSLAFAEGNDYIGGGAKFWLRGDDTMGKFLKFPAAAIVRTYSAKKSAASYSGAAPSLTWAAQASP